MWHQVYYSLSFHNGVPIHTVHPVHTVLTFYSLVLCSIGGQRNKHNYSIKTIHWRKRGHNYVLCKELSVLSVQSI